MMASAQQQQPTMMPGNFEFQQQQIQKMNMQKQQHMIQQQQQQIIQMKKQQMVENPVLTTFMAQRAQQQQHMIRSQQFPQQMNFQQQMMQARGKEHDDSKITTIQMPNAMTIILFFQWKAATW